MRASGANPYMVPASRPADQLRVMAPIARYIALAFRKKARIQTILKDKRGFPEKNLRGANRGKKPIKRSDA